MGSSCSSCCDNTVSVMTISPDNFYVENDSNTTLRVRITQPLRRLRNTATVREEDTDENQGDGSEGTKGGKKTTVKEWKSTSGPLYLQDETSFALIGPKHALLFYLPAGSGRHPNDRVFLSITTVLPDGKEDDTSVVICNNYHPPQNACVIIGSDLNIRLAHRQKKTVPYY